MGSMISAFHIIRVLIPLILICSFSAGCRKTSDELPQAVSGVLDLKGWNFKSEGILKLDGYWEFYREKFIAPCGTSCTPSAQNNSDRIKVPGNWDNHIAKDKEFGSYRLILRNLTGSGNAVKLNGIYGGYILYINGHSVSQAGTVGRSADESVFELKSELVPLPDGASELELVLHLSNFDHSRGGLRNTLYIGQYKELEELRRRTLETDFFLFGALLMMSLYHLGLYSLRRTDRSALYFAAVCLLFSLRPIFIGEHEIADLLNYPYNIYMIRLEYILLYLTLPFYYLYIREIFPSEFRNRTMNYCMAYLIAVCAVPTVFSAKIFTELLFLFHIGVILTVLTSIAFIILAVIRKREGSLIFSLGILIVSVCAVNDLLYARGAIFTKNYISHGVFFFIFSQAYLLSSRFSKAFRDSEISRSMAEEQRLLAEERKTEIEKLNGMKDEFLANLSHELKTPLTYIYMYSEMLTEPNEQETVIEYGKELLGNAKKLNDYLEDLILMTDIESMKELHLESVSFASAVEENILSLKSESTQNHVSISYNTEEDDTVLCDRHLFVKMLYAVMKNAILYNREGGSVVLSFQKNAKECIFSCRDTGIGISEKMKERVFEKFFRADSSLKYEKSGVGIGLYLASRIASLHGGRIELDSEEGKGSEFRIIFPLRNYN